MVDLKELRTYFVEARRLPLDGHGGCRLWDLLTCFPVWQRALAPEANPLVDQRPWLTFPAISFLKRSLTPHMRVFEFGAGGSTLFFARHAGEVVSVEHDASWGRKVQAALSELGLSRARVLLAPPEPNGMVNEFDPADPAGCISSAEQYRGQSFHNYVAQVDAWPDNHFDLIVVDGRARPACVRRSLPKVKPGGWLLLDNAERPRYQPALAELALSGWTKRDFSGPGPYHPAFWRTWAWQKPAA
jgi:hypothetical protein